MQMKRQRWLSEQLCRQGPAFFLKFNIQQNWIQDEVDKSVYAKMADDLEHAAKKLKKRKVKKVKESPAELTA